MIETWRPIAGYEGLYEVSDQGRVRSLARITLRNDGQTRPVKARILMPGRVARYLSVNLWKDNWYVTRTIHSLVLETFVGPRPEGYEACHADGDRENPRLTNLRWGTPAENGAERVRHGTQARGERHGMAKLSIKDVNIIRLMLGVTSQTAIAKAFKIDPAVVSNIKHGKLWAGVN